MDIFFALLGPIIILFVALAFYIYPPAKPNLLYGYRTPASMKTQEARDQANRYSSKWMLRVSLFLLLVILALVSLGLPARQIGLSSAGGVLVGVLAVIIATEIHLAKRNPKHSRNR